MKVLFQSRLDLFNKKGGDTVQILETKKALEALGVSVVIDNSINPNVSEFDIIHVFNLDWVCEPYLQISNAKKQKKPVVLSPIHHSLLEFEKYENLNRYGLVKLGNFIISSQEKRDIARNILKGVQNLSKLYPAIVQAFMGIRKQQYLSVSLANHILVQTELEAKDLKNDYKTNNFPWTKVVNGIDTKKFSAGSNLKVPSENTILCVGRIEPRKNQISLAKAFIKAQEQGTILDYKLVFVGGVNNNHPTYHLEFNKLIKQNSNIVHLGFVEQEKLCEIYKKSKVYALSSWFETTGLVFLEAVSCGIKSIVASGDRAKEYLEENAIYCNPESISSQVTSLQQAVERPTVNPNFKEFVKKTYTWENCAIKTLEVYNKVLGK